MLEENLSIGFVNARCMAIQSGATSSFRSDRRDIGLRMASCGYYGFSRGRAARSTPPSDQFSIQSSATLSLSVTSRTLNWNGLTFVSKHVTKVAASRYCLEK